MLKRSTLFLALASGLGAQQLGRPEYGTLRGNALAPAVTAGRGASRSAPGWWQRHLGDTAIHGAATTADIISSRGLVELNPLLRDSRDQLGARGIAIKYGAFVAIESAKWALLCRGHRGAWVRALSLGPAGVYGAAAAHNWRIK